MENKYMMNNEYKNILEEQNKELEKKENNIVGLNKVKIVKKIEYDENGYITSPAIVDLYI